jgi:hypothetical protein
MEARSGLNYQKAEALALVQAGKDERWLQDLIEGDPSVLGLGELTVYARERRQSPGGRLDLLLWEPETENMFEVEVMLGRTNESHIIRTVEYWDNERRRWPNREHRAVIVAEEITNRFFNVIALFNRAIPIIAIQLNALRVDDKLVLDFTKVLELYEPPEVGEPQDEQANRAYWEGRSNPQSLSVFDTCTELLRQVGVEPKEIYNKGVIVLSGSHHVFARFYPKKQQSHCLVRLRLADSDRDALAQQLENAGISASKIGWSQLSIPLTPTDLERSGGVVREALKVAWQTVGEGIAPDDDDEGPVVAKG